MDKTKTRLDTRKHMKQLRDIGSLHRSNLPEKTKHRLRIITWYGRKTVGTICSYFEISRSWFYRLLNTFFNQGLKGLMKKTGRPRGSTIPDPFAREIKRVREANPRVGSRRIKFLLQAPVHHSTVHRLLRGLGLVQERPYKRRVWKRFRAEYPNKRWQIDVTETLLHGRTLYKITVVDDHSNYRLVSHLSWDATGATIARILEEAIREYGAPEELLSDNGVQFRGRKGGVTLEVGGPGLGGTAPSPPSSRIGESPRLSWTGTLSAPSGRCSPAHLGDSDAWVCCWGALPWWRLSVNVVWCGGPGVLWLRSWIWSASAWFVVFRRTRTASCRLPRPL